MSYINDTIKYFNSVTGQDDRNLPDAASAYYKKVLADGGPPASVPAATTSTNGTVKKAASVPNLTDSSTGTSGGNTVGAVTDVATAANAIATLTAKINALQTALRNAGTLT